MKKADLSQTLQLFLWFGVFALVPLKSLGHHSHANYLEGEWLYLEGTVREIHWMNPHSWIYLDVVDSDGQSRAWAIEGASITTLRRDGCFRPVADIRESPAVLLFEQSYRFTALESAD